MPTAAHPPRHQVERGPGGEGRALLFRNHVVAEHANALDLDFHGVTRGHVANPGGRAGGDHVAWQQREEARS